ncbi:hypothetical protein GCM10018966_032000 [Streptomyces yanii]
MGAEEPSIGRVQMPSGVRTAMVLPSREMAGSVSSVVAFGVRSFSDFSYPVFSYGGAEADGSAVHQHGVRTVAGGQPVGHRRPVPRAGRRSGPSGLLSRAK